jgi:hypothetical protein
LRGTRITVKPLGSSITGFAIAVAAGTDDLLATLLGLIPMALGMEAGSEWHALRGPADYRRTAGVGCGDGVLGAGRYLIVHGQEELANLKAEAHS